MPNGRQPKCQNVTNSKVSPLRLTNRREKKHQEERQTEGRKTSRRRTYKKGRMITSYQFEQKILKIKKETNIESLS
jgi:hypothetical protein